ncbi:cellobiohydrolaseI [Lindgomyces ingoldianus]|uniref:CellobiohydrolaseI n=1 Tax=Lindgomyces ingoldianus TaxID=673940 RepID=A0ACB6R2G6_9PLEO|nr:cellobiohydrolaseI [Lindgomyces ingoldianus]KAF2472520.1 cellobiohydrolaseI [Lindgomyces ingoldianus]
MYQRSILTASLFAASTWAQVPGPLTPEVHPPITSYKCTKAGGCVAQKSGIVLDANYRWLHNKEGYTNCVTTGFNKDFCPDIETCAKTCSLEGVDYASYGIRTSGDALTLNIYKTDPATNVTSLSSPRVYLMSDDETFDHFKLLNAEFSFDVDVSKVPCGINGALYFSEMNAKGDANELNKAGAKYGTGYCDAQCPSQNFIKGRANLNGTYGACCNEMDIWEANNAATAYTPHPCNANQVFACSGTECGNGDSRYKGVCDKDGCDNNPYRMGDKRYYGVGTNYTVDTSKKLTVVTQFYTTDNTATGTLKEIRRLYIQNGKIIQNAKVSIAGMSTEGSITDAYCASNKKVLGGTDHFTQLGGLKTMGDALGRGMVLALSIWDDSGSYMGWLDQERYPADADAATPGVGRGPCPVTGGRPAELIKQYPDAKVVFSNIRSGEIGSTFSNGTVLRFARH